MPNKLPEGDPSEFALPVFLKEPRKTYATKEDAGNLTCRVAHAKTVHFTCDGEKMDSNTERDGVAKIGSTESKYKEITISIRRSQVLDTLEKFSCKCHASSSQGEVESQPALVEIACKSVSTLFAPELVQTHRQQTIIDLQTCNGIVY